MSRLQMRRCFRPRPIFFSPEAECPDSPPQERLAIARDLADAQKRAIAAERRATVAEAASAAGAAERRRLMSAVKAANTDLKGLDTALTASDSQRRREQHEAQAKLTLAAQRRCAPGAAQLRHTPLQPIGGPL